MNDKHAFRFILGLSVVFLVGVYFFLSYGFSLLVDDIVKIDLKGLQYFGLTVFLLFIYLVGFIVDKIIEADRLKEDADGPNYDEEDEDEDDEYDH